MATEYKSAREVDQVARDLIYDFHPHLSSTRIEYVFISKTPKRRGKHIWGRAKKITGLSAYLSGEGPERHEMAEPEDYFVMEIAEPIWQKLDEKCRRALVDHELSHFDLDGNGKLTLRPHDLEEFTMIVRRYGLWRADVKFFVEAGIEQAKLPFEKGKIELVQSKEATA